MFPGYVLVNMVMNDDTWYVVRNTRGVTGFVGPGSDPVPLSEAEWKNRKNKRSGKEPIEPLYTTQDVQNALKYFTPCEYDESYQIFDGIEIKFIDAGHL